MEWIGTLVALVCFGLPLLLVAAFLVISFTIAVGAIVPMYAAFGLGLLVKNGYRSLTTPPPRRALIE